MKKLFVGIVIVVLILFVLSFAKDIIAKTAVSAGVRAITGLNLSMRSINIGILKTLVGINGLKLFNPVGFPDRLMMDMPEIYVDYNLGAIFRGKIHLRELRLNLKEFVVIKNESGQLNLDSLKVVKEKKQKRVRAEAAGIMPFQIDVLELKVGKVIYKDYSGGTPPMVQEFNVNINERYENITDPYNLARLIVVRTLRKTIISRLANFDLGPLQDQLGKTLQEAGKIAEELGGKALGDVATKAQGAAQEAAEKAGEAIKKIFPNFE